MKRALATVFVLLCLASFTHNNFAQTSNASVGGFVQDSSGAYIPGVTVTAANIQTGVATTAVTNESGAYNIPSLLPGTYKLSAELPGFKTRVFNDVVLGGPILHGLAECDGRFFMLTKRREFSAILAVTF